ncbi:MAG TPA: sulfatase-like hydrolase/transferase, partial [bacterium]|nr:sulfatase-like hydrolase/transferase [bacterium]
GQWHNVGRLRDVEETLLHPLKQLGYRTCHVGKSHLHPHGSGRDLRDAIPFMNALGWDDVLECTGPWSTRTTTSILTDWMKTEGIFDLFMEDYARRKQAGVKNLWPSPLPDGKHPDDFIARTAVNYIHDSDPSAPLYLFVGFGGPHEPWDSPVRFDTYQPEDMPPPLPRDGVPDWLSNPARDFQERTTSHNPSVTENDWARIRTLYSGRVEHVDSCLGEVLKAWYQKRGQDTWVVFWADHGEMLGDKAHSGKCVFYESSVRVPAIIRPPQGCSSPIVSNALVGLTDLTATVLDAAEYTSLSQNIFGHSLLGVFENSDSVGSPYVVSEIGHSTMIFDGIWKLVVDSRDETLQFFNLQADPTESLNLAGKPDLSEVEKHLRASLRHFLLRTQYRQHREKNG